MGAARFRKRHAVGLAVLGAGATMLAGERATRARGEAVAEAATTAQPASAPIALPPPNPLDEIAHRPATDVSLAPGKEGRLGAWLVVGPFSGNSLQRAPWGVDEAHLSPTLGAEVGEGAHKPKWSIAFSNEGSIDLQSTLGTKDDNQIAYAAGTLHVEKAGRHYLFLGADDGVKVTVDGRDVYARDEARPPREDDDVVPLDLGAGDHTVLLKLHQRDGAWEMAARFVDATFATPEGGYLSLPGTTAADARMLATKLSWVSVERAVGDVGYAPKLTVRFLEGVPRGVPLTVRAKLVHGAPPKAPTGIARRDHTPDPPPPPEGEPLFDVQAGEVPVDARGAGELVVALPALHGDLLGKVEDGDWAFAVDVAGRDVRPSFHPRRAVREAIAHAARALASLDASSSSWLPAASKDSAQHLHDRLARFVAKGDLDIESQLGDARELEEIAAELEAKKDPYATRTGPMRRAYRSPTDGELSEYGLYVPASYATRDPDKKYPLIVALHGMNGNGMQVLRWVFGWDTGRDAAWENRHIPTNLPRFEGIVISPDAYGNAMYRDLGEDDVMRVLEWAIKTYPIDPQKVTVTGMSMGGIGTAAIAFHHPGLFSAAEPLCGYHSYFIRRDYGGRPVRPWERAIADERSNVSWAYNGYRIPLWIVHGKKDLPEANSGVLIDRYKALGYPLKHDHPDSGHNVWSETYAGLKGLSWLTWPKKDLHPKLVRFRTIRPRFADNAWVHVEELSAPGGEWGQIEARVKSRSEIAITTSGIAELSLAPDAELVDDGPLTVVADGAKIEVPAERPIWLHEENGAWVAGRAAHAGAYKHGEITGPLRDVFHSPIVFVYGADDPQQTRMNEEVARTWARMRWGVTAKFPVMTDAELLASGETPATTQRALFLVGNAKSNRVVRELEPDFPIKIDGDAVVLGQERITGEQLGAAFIRPNPRNPSRYVVVVEGVDALGTWRSLSLPELLPDFVVYDAGVAPARGQQLLSAGMVRAGGFFGNDWSIPTDTADPSARGERPMPKNEHDATPYLP